MALRDYLGARGEPAGRVLLAVAGVLTLAAVSSPRASHQPPAPAAPGPAATARAASAYNATASNGKLRNGWDRREPSLTPALLRSGAFGRTFTARLRGQVYAQPLVIGGTVIAATERNWVYGLNARTGRVRWRHSLGKPWPARATSCRDIAPQVGITSTPVYDPRNHTVYLVADTIGKSARHPTYRLFGIKARTGRVTKRIKIAGRPANDRGLTFNAFTEYQRTGLLLLGNRVYAAFGSHCDDRPYTGYVASVNVATKTVRLWTDEAGVTGQDGGIWQSGGGLMSDGPGRIFLTTGNGVSPPPGPGSAPPAQLGDSVVALAAPRGGTMTATDFFSPGDAPALDAANTDFGSGGPVGLPFGTSAHRRLLAQAGKDGRLFLLDRTGLGGREQGPGGRNKYVAKAGPFAGQWGHLAAFGNTSVLTARDSARSRDYLYYLGKKDNLRFLRLRAGAGGTARLRDVANSTQRFAFSSGSPVVTSNGTKAASAIVWVVKSAGGTGARGALEAFRAVPPARCGKRACAVRPLWTGRIGTASKFSVAATGGGHVYVGTRGGLLIGFGRRVRAGLAAHPPVDLGPAAVSRTASREVTVTATQPLTVTAVRTSASIAPNPFRAGQLTRTASGAAAAAPVRLPVRLAPGDALHVRVSFRPAALGGMTGVLSLVTPTARYGSTDVPLSGEGAGPGLYSQPGRLKFLLADGEASTRVPAGLVVPMTADLTNGGTTATTITSVTVPGRPFQVTGLPAPGTVIGPGQSVSVQVSYAPAGAGSSRATISVRTSNGKLLRLPLTGHAKAPVSKIIAAPAAVRLGPVRVGSRVKAAIAITNAGNLPATVSVAAPPGSPFLAGYRVPRGLPVNPGYQLRIPVTFAPAAPGRATGVYRLTWTDLLGSHTLRVTLTGTGKG